MAPIDQRPRLAKSAEPAARVTAEEPEVRLCRVYLRACGALQPGSLQPLRACRDQSRIPGSSDGWIERVLPTTDSLTAPAKALAELHVEI